MQEETQDDPPRQDAQHKRGPSIENDAGGVKTKRRIRSLITCGMLATIFGVLTGFFVSLHKDFTVPSILCLLAVFITAAIAFIIDFERYQGKHCLAKWGGGIIITAGLGLCGYLWFWNKHRPADVANLTYKAVTNLPEELASKLSQNARRQITEAQKQTIRRMISPGVQISIMPLVPGEPEDFANALRIAFADAGARVSIGTANMIMDGTEGLLVRYDRGDPRCKSVFLALDAANLNPLDNGDIPGNKVVFIRVAPKAK